ncbi:Dbl homology (DH) domain protein [Kalmanozyma brasiliensis GHG001]|uniref:DH domain-containing protein n=1 Tax=Kalmanozyma brasiliensis (strain GHG001) TaxID=1365824 RepID=V5EZR4_KALBG|nr:Dbl homology (DH) domain protein [Kalmanozyma brasiliensis GHG001]EST09433.1 Dbl homology (DH) domain protein [Kalmanozyma brasiliensis GHG001]
MVVLLEDAVGRICNGTAEEAAQLLAQGQVNEESETDRVGQVFLKMMPRIEQVYSAYCSRHEVSMARLQELLSTQPKVGSFLSECTRAARAYTNAWDLSSLLIKPVQRVLKYPLLLSQILASTSAKHPDSESLSAASVEIQKVADNINEVKKRKDLVEQIVSGKTTKRTTSQRMQHGATKKLLRRQEKVKKLVLGPAEDILADDGQYKALVVQFRQLEKSTGAFARRCIGWSSSVKDVHVTQLRMLEQWGRAYAVEEVAARTEAELRLRAFAELVEGTLLKAYWTQLDAEISKGLKPAIQRISAMFTLPQAVLAKRDDREPDYTRYRTEIARGGAKAVDKKLTESANAFVALHTQLMNELPQFNYGVQTLLDLCIESLARTQASYHLRVQQALIGFWQTYGPEGNTDIAINEETDERSMGHVNPVKIFWPLHSNMAGFAESLGIIQGTTSNRRSRSTSLSVDNELLTASNISPASTNHFSPLQSDRALPDPEFASMVPDATSMSQQIESITGAGSEELLTPMSERASPAAFSTPPLGSQGRASLSPQLRQAPLLGSPAPIGSVPGGIDQRPSLRTAKSGGLIGLLRSVSGAPSAGSRKGSQSFDTANESFEVSTSSDPPTPVSKHTPDTTSDAVAAPTLPALTFNSGFFSQSDAVFTSASTRGLSEQAEGGRKAAKARMGSSSSAAAAMGTMAAVANSPARLKGTTKNGYLFIDYEVGDLFRVLDQDKTHLFGSSEHGVTGWVERENFVPLS